MESFKEKYEEMMKIFQSKEEAKKSPEEGKASDGNDDPRKKIELMEQLNFLIDTCLGNGHTGPVRRKRFFHKFGMANVTKALFVLNSASMSLERRGGFDSTNRIEMLEEQLIVQGLRLQKLEARLLDPGVGRSEGPQNGNDSSGSDDHGPDEDPDSGKGKVNPASRKSRKHSTGRDQDQN
jgi:hypothetical protein